MRRAMILLVAVVVATLLASGVAMTQPSADGPDRFIVVLKDGVDNPGEVASNISHRNNAEIGFVYRNAIKGFSAVIPNSRVAEVRADGRVDYVERDGRMHAVAQRLPWGINRIDADESLTVAGNGRGAITNVNAYIIDTGIDAGHADLNVTRNVNFAGGINGDCNGHGTHVAGTVAAKDNAAAVVGVAPGAPLTGVKVLGCRGGGSTSEVIAGVDWVTANARKPAIANISIEGEVRKALDDAVRRSSATGVFYSLAAGNLNADACNTSPARAGLAEKDTNSDGVVNHNDSNGIVTTAATTKATDAEAEDSNHGKCVDIWAPGVEIPSTRLGGGTTMMSGTSMASPHVGGTGALYLSQNTGASPTAVERVLKAEATTPGTTSHNGRKIKLLYAGDF